MTFVALIAKRFLTGKKRNAFLSFIAGVSLFGVALGVAALLVVMGVMEGFERELQSVITGTHSHIVLFSVKREIPNRYDLMEQVRAVAANDIEAMSPYVFSEVMLANKERVVGSLLEGIEEDSAIKTTEIKRYIMRGSFPFSAVSNLKGDTLKLPGIVLGSVVAEQLQAKLNEEITVISPFFDTNSLQPKTGRFVVSGIMNTGMYEYDSKNSFITIEEALRFFQLPTSAANALKIKTKNLDSSIKVANKLKEAMPYPYIAKDWTERNHNLLYAIKLQKAVIFVVLTAIILVAAFNIMSTLVMMMSEKKREMSILKAMGMGARQSAYVFISIGTIIGVSGACAGVALGIFICQILAHTRFIHLPADIYFISYLPVNVRPIMLLIVAGVACLIALLATLYPAYLVAKESPVEGLRYE